MKQYIFFLAVFFIISSCTYENKIQHRTGPESIAYKWGKITMECTADDTEKFSPRPTITSRFLGLIWTAVFDAWSRYDDLASPVYLTGIDRLPQEARTLKNKEIAISYAAYRTLMEYYPFDSVMITQKMKEFGYDPFDNSLDATTPVGIGNLAARAIIHARMHDGANQTGTRPGSDAISYGDYTGYQPRNTADKMNEVSHWQPKYFSDGKGGKFAPGCLTAQWYLVNPLLLDSANQFRPGPPPKFDSDELIKELTEVVDMQRNLTNEQKALVEFMRDGPRSVQQAGHWFVFAQEVSVRDKHTLDQDVKMYFLVEAAAMDAFIACWDAKMHYDFARPYTLVHHYFKDQVMEAWGGPEKGMVSMKGEDWRPYSPETFLCPAFPSYVSGHSTVSGACAETLRLFTGSDNFGITVKRTPGELTEPNNPGEPVVLEFPTFTETANMAGISRVLGGYHIQSENLEGLKLGRSVANNVWKKYLKYIGEAK